MSPSWSELDRLLEDDQLFQRVKADLSRRRPHTLATGRPSTPVEVILRLLVIHHLYAWSYEQTEHFVGDSLVLRQFCRLGLTPVPHATTLLRWANLVQPETLHALLDRVTELARSLKVTRGRKLRIDSTVVQTTIHHPSDSGLLADGVRIISRLVRRARQVLRRSAEPVFRDRTRSAKRLMRRIHASAAQGRGPGRASEWPCTADSCGSQMPALARPPRCSGSCAHAPAVLPGGYGPSWPTSSRWCSKPRSDPATRAGG